MNKIITRGAAGRLAAALRVMPAVVVTGPRQVGKSTMAKQLAGPAWPYCTLDSLDPGTGLA